MRMDMQIHFPIEVLPSGLLHPLTIAKTPTTYTYYPLPKKEAESATSYELRWGHLNSLFRERLHTIISWEPLSSMLRKMVVLCAIVFLCYSPIILCQSSNFNLMKLRKINTPLLHRKNFWSSVVVGHVLFFAVPACIGR